MSRSLPPTIRVIDQGMHVRFPPQHHWGFVSAQRFELRIEGEVPMSALRHSHAQLYDVSLSISFKDLETLLASRLRGSEFKEIHLSGTSSNTSGQPSPLMCWGVFQSQKVGIKEPRPQVFYLEGGFHALAHSLRFEVYQGVLFGVGEVNAQTLAMRLIREAGLPAQRTHPTVLNFDPLTELSLSYCLDWGWKLPQRRIESEIEINEREILFISGRTRENYLKTIFHPDVEKVTPQQRLHLKKLRMFHEGESLMQAEELESAKIFYKGHLGQVPAAMRYFELSRWLGEPGEHLLEWCNEVSLSEPDRARAHALIAEGRADYEVAAARWRDFIQAEIEAFRQASISSPSERSPFATTVLQGLTDFTIGLLLKELSPELSLSALESARASLSPSPILLHTIAEIAHHQEDIVLAQARLTECAQLYIAKQQSVEAAQTWVKLGDLWIGSVETFDNAERAYRRALEIEPTALKPYYSLSKLNEMRGDYIAARALLERVLELSPYAKKAHDAINRLALLSEERDDSSALASFDESFSVYDREELVSVGEVTRLPQETQEQVSRVSSAAPLPSSANVMTDRTAYFSNEAQVTGRPVSRSDQSPESLEPPPKPLSAGPYAQNDPWSLAPQESIDDWLSEGKRAESVIKEQEKSSSSDRITALPQAMTSPDTKEMQLQDDVLDEKRSEKITAAPQKQRPTSPVPQAEPSISRSERETSPPPQVKSSRVEQGFSARTLPKPPRVEATPPRFQVQDLDVLNEAISFNTVFSHSHERTEARSERITAAPKVEQVEEEVDDLTHLAEKSERFDAGIESLQTSEEARLEAAELELKLEGHLSDDERGETLLTLAVLCRDRLFDLDAAKRWLWGALGLTLNEEIRVEATESLAELFTVTEDREGLLEYYEFVASQPWGNSGESHLQRASVLRSLGRSAEAIAACDQALTALSVVSGSRRDREKSAERYEESLRLKADLLVAFDKPEAAVSTLLDQVSQLDAVRSALRKMYAARLSRDTQPDRAAALFQDAYEDSPSDETLEEWIAHVNHWGNPQARASAVRASIEHLDDLGDQARVASRRLSQLAEELRSEAPLLALELLQESLLHQVDLDTVEILIELAEERDQYLSLIEGLEYLIPECFEGEYRGMLKLKRAFALMVISDAQAEGAVTHALSDFEGELESKEELEALLGWAESRLDSSAYYQLLSRLDKAGLLGS